VGSIRAEKEEPLARDGLFSKTDVDEFFAFFCPMKNASSIAPWSSLTALHRLALPLQALLIHEKSWGVVRQVLEECLRRLDVALFNALLRGPRPPHSQSGGERRSEDPVADPLSDEAAAKLVPGALQVRNETGLSYRVRAKVRARVALTLHYTGKG